MYEKKHLGLKQMQVFLGVGRNTLLRLCQERPYNFPVVRVGNKYQSDEEKLKKWYDDWYQGKFEI